jgi:hypothetical protein
MLVHGPGVAGMDDGNKLADLPWPVVERATTLQLAAKKPKVTINVMQPRRLLVNQAKNSDQHRIFDCREFVDAVTISVR